MVRLRVVTGWPSILSGVAAWAAGLVRKTPKAATITTITTANRATLGRRISTLFRPASSTIAPSSSSVEITRWGVIGHVDDPFPRDPANSGSRLALPRGAAPSSGRDSNLEGDDSALP